MPYIPFYEKYPNIAKNETRTITAFNSLILPNGDYGLIEAYCDEDGCDCRRVLFNVIDWKTNEIKAVIAFGWESKEYYKKWLGYDDQNIIKELQGPCLHSASEQSPLAPALLEVVYYYIKEKRFINRLKRHYLIFKFGTKPNKEERNRKLDKNSDI